MTISTSDTDESLLSSYRSDEQLETLGILYNRYIHLVYGVCLKYLKSREDAQDMVMTIFEGLPKKMRGKDITYFKSWLYVVTKNECLMKLRKTNDSIVQVDFMENTSDYHLTDEDDLSEESVGLEDCIDQLKPEHKTCIAMFYFENKSYAEVSDQSGFSLKEVKSYIQNGKRNLKICLEEKREESNV